MILHKTKILFSAEIIGEDLIALGITADTIWQDFNLVLTKVCGYSPSLSTNGDTVENETEVLMPDGLITINTPYDSFHKLMNRLY